MHNLQATLALIQQGTNERYLWKRTELEEARDYELTRLRLWEEYQVKRAEDEYKQDMATAKANYDMMIKLLKEKFYDKLLRQVKQLKEDKLLLNLVNASLWSATSKEYASVLALTAAAAALQISINDRRLLRKRELTLRFTAGETDDLSDSGLGSSTANGTLRYATGYALLSSKRRRHYATRYSSNDELSGNATNSGAQHVHHAASGNDSALSDKDYDTLNSMIMNNEDGGMSKIFDEKAGSSRSGTRSSKQFVGVQGLKPEELDDDLHLLRTAIKR